MPRGGYQKRIKELSPVPCVWCSKDFIPFRITNKYCSSKCAKEARLLKNRENVTKEQRREYNKKHKEKHPAKKMLNSVKSRGNINLTEEWVQDRLDTGTCEVTGIKFSTYKYGNTEDKGWGARDPFMPTIDRINPKNGYTKENSRMVVWIYNLAKSTWSDDIVLEMAKKLIKKEEI